MADKKIFITWIFSLSMVYIGFSQSTFPSDSLDKFYAVRAESASNPTKEYIREKYMEADRILQRVFEPGKKIVITLRYSTIFHVMDEVPSNYYVTFNDNENLIILWFRRTTSSMKPEFASSNELIAQIESTKENTNLELEIEILPAGARSSTYAISDGLKLFIHAKLLAVKEK